MSQNPTYLIANWKMNGDAVRAQRWAFAVNQSLAQLPTGVAVVLCPPLPLLAAAQSALPPNAQLQLGAQNCHHEKAGAHTGEVSAGMLAGAGCRFVILGHSERRATGETDGEMLAKAEAALSAGLTPIICIGESRAQYEAKETHAVIAKQLAPLAALAGQHYLVAYEPIWAIGSSKTPEMSEIAAAHAYIKSVLGSETCVLYGGSVNAGNIGKILELPEVAGALIGGASLEIESMQAMIAAANAGRS